MIKQLILEILLIVIILFFIIKILKINKSYKYNKRLSKYIVNNNYNNRISFGDKITNIYNNFINMLVKSLNNSIYFKNKSIKYNKYSYVNNSLNIIATKLSLSIIFGIIYLISSLYNNKFNIMFMILFMIIGYFIYNIYLLINERIRNKYIEEDLLKAIMIMNNAFKSGYNITQAVNIVGKDLTGPISDEFIKISNDLKYGLDLKDVFDRFYDRVHIEDVKYMTSSLSLINITGGNLVGIFESIEKSFTNKKRLRDELNAMTSSSKLVFYILLGIPIIIISLLLIISPDYYSPLFNHPIGFIIILISLLLYIGYILIIKKILKIDTY